MREHKGFTGRLYDDRSDGGYSEFKEVCVFLNLNDILYSDLRAAMLDASGFG